MFTQYLSHVHVGIARSFDWLFIQSMRSQPGGEQTFTSIVKCDGDDIKFTSGRVHAGTHCGHFALLPALGLGMLALRQPRIFL